MCVVWDFEVFVFWDDVVLFGPKRREGVELSRLWRQGEQPNVG